MPSSGAVGPRLQAAFREGNWSSELRRVVERGQELARDVQGARPCPKRPDGGKTCTSTRSRAGDLGQSAARRAT
jgi:hypothetical protein